MPLTAQLCSPLRPVGSLLLRVLPQGGQGVARRNAWAGMSADARRARERRQAEAALAAAEHRAYRPRETRGGALR